MDRSACVNYKALARFRVTLTSVQVAPWIRKVQWLLAPGVAGPLVDIWRYWHWERDGGMDNDKCLNDQVHQPAVCFPCSAAHDD